MDLVCSATLADGRRVLLNLRPPRTSMGGWCLDIILDEPPNQLTEVVASVVLERPAAVTLATNLVKSL